MFSSVFGGLKQTILILEKTERLAENIKRLTEKIESLERRITQIEHGNELATVRSEALVESIRSSTTAVVERATSHHYGMVVERIVRIECRLETLDGKSQEPQISRLMRNDRPGSDDQAT